MDSLVHFKNMIGRGQVQVDDGDDDDDDDEDDGDGEDEDEDGDDEDAGHHVLSYMCVCVSNMPHAGDLSGQRGAKGRAEVDPILMAAPDQGGR